MPQPLSATELKAVQDLKDELEHRKLTLPEAMVPLGDTDATLYRFVKARKFDIALAADMISDTIKWRQENEVDDYLSRTLPDGRDNIIRRCLPSGWIGFDKTGLPVWMEHLAALDIPGMEGAGVTVDDYCFYQVRAMEYFARVKLPEASARHGSDIHTHCIIVDLNGLRLGLMTKSTVNIFQTVSALYQAHYPEFMTRMFIVNIPMIFGAIWRVASMFVDERVKMKIRFLKKSELHMLHEFIDRKMLPVSLGGDCTEQLISTRGGFVPASHKAMDEEIARRAAAKLKPLSREPSTGFQTQQRESFLRRLSRVSSQALRRMSQSSADVASVPGTPSTTSHAPSVANSFLAPLASQQLPTVPSMSELVTSEDSAPLLTALTAEVAGRADAIGGRSSSVPDDSLIRRSMQPHTLSRQSLASGLRRPSAAPTTMSTGPGTAPGTGRRDMSQAPRLFTSSICLQQATASARAPLPVHEPSENGPAAGNRASAVPDISRYSAFANAGHRDVPAPGLGPSREGEEEEDSWQALGELRRVESSPNLNMDMGLPKSFWRQGDGRSKRQQRREDRQAAKQEKRAVKEASRRDKRNAKQERQAEKQTQRQARRTTTDSPSKSRRLLNCLAGKTTGEPEDSTQRFDSAREANGDASRPDGRDEYASVGHPRAPLPVRLPPRAYASMSMGSQTPHKTSRSPLVSERESVGSIASTREGSVTDVSVHSGNANGAPIAWHGNFGRSWSMPNLKLLQQPESSRPTPAPSLVASAAHSMAHAVPALAPIAAAVGAEDVADGSPRSARVSEASSSDDDELSNSSPARLLHIPSSSSPPARPQREILSPTARGMGALGPITEERGSQLRLNDLDRPSQQRPENNHQQQDWQQQDKLQHQQQHASSLQRCAQVLLHDRHAVQPSLAPAVSVLAKLSLLATAAYYTYQLAFLRPDPPTSVWGTIQDSLAKASL